jgi:hypothetical protein
MERLFHDGRSAMAEAPVSSTARSALHDLDDFYVQSMRPQPAVPVVDGYGTRAYSENDADNIQGRANVPQICQVTTISSDGQGGSSDPAVGAMSQSARRG